jgi:hypothetical protein
VSVITPLWLLFGLETAVSLNPTNKTTNTTKLKLNNKPKRFITILP